MRPVRSATLTDQCYEQLKTAIINLELPPRSHLSENQLAERFGISKSPVREALVRLAGEGFLVSEGGRRSRVADLDVQTIRDFYQLRMYLETSSLLEVAPTLEAADVEHLQRLVEEDRMFLESGNHPNVVLKSNQFHLFLIEKSHNAHLIRIARHLFDQANRVRTAIQLVEKDAEQQDLSFQGLENHRGILHALIAREPERATDLLRSDIELFLNAATSPKLQRAFDKLAAAP